MATYQGTKVAVKEPIDPRALTPSAIAEFRGELTLAYSMRHKNVVCILLSESSVRMMNMDKSQVAVYGGGLGYMDDESSPPEFVDHPFMVMEFMTNKSLAHLVFAERATLTLQQVECSSQTSVKRVFVDMFSIVGSQAQSWYYFSFSVSARTQAKYHSSRSEAGEHFA